MNSTLSIGLTSSRCMNCRRDADPYEETHDTILGYGPDNGKPGCGVRWTHVIAEYANTEGRIRQMRPDLELVNVSE